MLVTSDTSLPRKEFNLKEPKDKKGVQRLLGMVNYVSKFVPNVSEITSPLRELLKKDVSWHWSVTHEKSVRQD
jgi:hypothetical protein